MKFLVDADLPKSLAVFLRNFGYEVSDVRDTLRPDSPDKEIFNFAKEQNQIIITRNLDFANILLYPPEENFAIIVFRTHLLSYTEMFQLLKNFLKKTPETEILGSLIIIQKDRFRIRRPK